MVMTLARLCDPAGVSFELKECYGGRSSPLSTLKNQDKTFFACSSTRLLICFENMEAKKGSSILISTSEG